MQKSFSGDEYFRDFDFRIPARFIQSPGSTVVLSGKRSGCEDGEDAPGCPRDPRDRGMPHYVPGVQEQLEGH